MPADVEAPPDRDDVGSDRSDVVTVIAVLVCFATRDRLGARRGGVSVAEIARTDGSR